MGNNATLVPESLYAFHPKRPKTLFIAAIGVTFFLSLFVRAQLLFSGGMYAEMAVNYFPTAKSDSIFERFFGQDYGYVPLLHRIIAVFGEFLGLHAGVMPYFYTWSAFILSILLVTPFALKQFRWVIRNDWLRFFIVLTVYFYMDLETATFLNFIYYAAFTLIIVASLALVQRHEEVPLWCWGLPILFMGKPGLWAVLPMFVVVAFVSLPRFRRIVYVSGLFVAAQLFFFMYYGQERSIASAYGSRIEQIGLVAKTFLQYIRVNMFPFTTSLLDFWGSFGMLAFVYATLFALILALLVLSFKFSGPETAIIVFGFVTIFLNYFILIFSQQVLTPVVANNRQHFIAFVGLMCVAAGVISAIESRIRLKEHALIQKALVSVAAVALFAVFAGNSIAKTVETNMLLQQRALTFGNSMWPDNAQAIQAGASPLCVSIDPVEWPAVYGNDCDQLANNIGLSSILTPLSSETPIEIIIPEQLQNTEIVAFGLMLESTGFAKFPIALEAVVEMKDGRRVSLVGSGEVDYRGSLSVVSSRQSIPASDIASITLRSDVPAMVHMDAEGNQPLMKWMGQRT